MVIMFDEKGDVSVSECTSQQCVVPEGAQNELIHRATVDSSFCKATVHFFWCPPAPSCAAKQLNASAESWAAWRRRVGGRSQIDQSFQRSPEAGRDNKVRP